MKSLLAALFLVGSFSVFAQSRPFPQPPRAGAELQQRVFQLETAVIELQQAVTRLERGGFGNKPPRPGQGNFGLVVCTLTTAFDGTFVGKAPTILEARAFVLNSCNQTTRGICDEKKIVCQNEF